MPVWFVGPSSTSQKAMHLSTAKTAAFTSPLAGRTVRLFLADGLPSGIVIAEMGNWSGKVLAAPRSRLPKLLRRAEATRTGIYLLVGPDPDRPGRLLLYIGEADDIAARMRIHLRSEAKDFFDRLVLIVSADDSLTKGHVRYLESRLIRLVQDAGSVSLTNDTHPDFQRLPEGDRADMDYFVEQVRLILPVLGLDLVKSRTVSPAVNSSALSTSEPIFAFSTGGAVARGRETDDGFVVLAGSTARKQTSGTFPAGYRVLRESLIADGRIAEGEGADPYRFTADVAFSSPSAAASIVSGRSASGPIEWKVEGSGQSYRDWRSKQLED